MVKYSYKINNSTIETIDINNIPNGVSYETIYFEIENQENYEFIYNNSTELDTYTDFSDWTHFYLTGDAVINSFGDKSKIIWKNDAGQIAIEEYPIYTRTKIGAGLLADFKLKREPLEIRFYRKNGTYEILTLPMRNYSKKERIDTERKSRSNIIDNTVTMTGKYIYQKNMVGGTPQKIETELASAKELFKSFSNELSVYRNDLDINPLVTGLTNFTPTENVKKDVIDFIFSKVNINYY